MYVFIVSGTIQHVGIPTSATNLYVNVTALLSGYGLTSQGKCGDPFNSYSTDKELLLLYSQCHMDLIEVTRKYVI